MSTPGPTGPPQPEPQRPYQPPYQRPPGPPVPGAEPDGYVTDGQLVTSGQLVLELRPPAGLISGSGITPEVTIDGHPVSAHWHTNVLTVPAGSRQVVVRLPYFRHSGYARFDAQVQPGQRTVVHYAAPASMHHRGAIGNRPPRNLSGWLIVGIVGGIGLVGLLLVVLAVIWVVTATPS